jgi:hypothetical protein
MELGAVS